MKTLNVSARQLLLTGMFATIAVLNAQTTTTPTYSTASLQGTFVLCESGTVQQSQNEYSTVATLSLDGAGNIAGTANIAAGAFSQTGNPVTGTYTVNAAGWGNLALAIAYSDGSGTTINANYMAILSSQGVMITRTDNGFFAQAQLMSQSQGAVSNAGHSGTFLIQEHGYTSNGPFILMGVIAFDGQGNVSGTANYQSLGLSNTAAVTGIYAIDTDGTEGLVLTLTISNPDGSSTSTTLRYCLSPLNPAGMSAGISALSGTTSTVLITPR